MNIWEVPPILISREWRLSRFLTIYCILISRKSLLSRFLTPPSFIELQSVSSGCVPWCTTLIGNIGMYDHDCSDVSSRHALGMIESLGRAQGDGIVITGDFSHMVYITQFLNTLWECAPLMILHIAMYGYDWYSSISVWYCWNVFWSLVVILFIGVKYMSRIGIRKPIYMSILSPF